MNAITVPSRTSSNQDELPRTETSVTYVVNNSEQALEALRDYLRQECRKEVEQGLGGCIPMNDQMGGVTVNAAAGLMGTHSQTVLILAQELNWITMHNRQFVPTVHGLDQRAVILADGRKDASRVKFKLTLLGIITILTA